jgi:hypothetical protein
MKRTLSIASLTFASLLCGCADNAPPDETVFHRTIVHLDGDGAPVVSTASVTAGEQRAQLAALTQELPSGVQQDAITSDASCLGSSIWLHDQANQTGNELCFFGKGSANLGSFVDVVIPDAGERSWSAAVRSYWAGSGSGSFTGPAVQAGASSCTSSFAAYRRADAVDNCTFAATKLTLAN